MKLASIQAKIDDCHEQYPEGLITHGEKAEKLKRLKDLGERIKPYQDRYNAIIEQESKLNEVTTKIKKSDWVPSIDYIWITFKDNDSSPK